MYKRRDRRLYFRCNGTYRNGTAELQRNTLAEELGCVPSQISYVLTSRFTPEKGYIVESRRGGGGYIRVQRVRYQSTAAPMMHTLNAIGEELAAGSAQAILENLLYEKCLTTEQARIMAAACRTKRTGIYRLNNGIDCGRQ